MVETEVLTIDSMTSDILSTGLSSSAVSLSSLINHDVNIQEMGTADNPGEVATTTDRHSNESILILKTELIGPIMGINYLLLTKPEVTTICDHVFGEELADENNSQFVIEFLKELENVLAASTITAISDALNVDMYGDVPKIQAAPYTEVPRIIDQETGKISPRVVLHADFHVPGINVSPRVLWFFNRSFQEIKQNING
ncbi:MAG: hypothetical protein Tsb0034_26900 [Ekhidna sp.]